MTDSGARSAWAAALWRRARQYDEEGRTGEAGQLLAAILRGDPDSWGAWNAFGAILRKHGHVAEAVSCYKRAIALSSGCAVAWSNLGNALSEIKQIHAALYCQRRAVRLEPDNAAFHHNLGTALADAHMNGEALASYDRALGLDPRRIDSRLGRAGIRLRLGDYSAGWDDFEARLTLRSRPGREAGERWAGEPYRGKRLLVLEEEGLGDAIWVARYFRQVKSLGGELFVQCHPRLVSLFASMGCIDRVVVSGEPLPAADYHCYLCSIPRFFTRHSDDVPSTPYLSVEVVQPGKYQWALDLAEQRLKVGIIWSGSVSYAANADRRAPLKAFIDAFWHPRIQLYSLQMGSPSGALARLDSLVSAASIIDLGPLMNDLLDTARLVSQLDLIIMTDSCVAHLAGALGKPVWLLLAHGPHWLWMMDRDDSPWYPSMRLFRPQAWNEWGSVFDAASAALMELADGS